MEVPVVGLYTLYIVLKIFKLREVVFLGKRFKLQISCKFRVPRATVIFIILISFKITLETFVLLFSLVYKHGVLQSETGSAVYYKILHY